MAHYDRIPVIVKRGAVEIEGKIIVSESTLVAPCLRHES